MPDPADPASYSWSELESLLESASTDQTGAFLQYDRMQYLAIVLDERHARGLANSDPDRASDVAENSTRIKCSVRLQASPRMSLYHYF